MDITGLVRRLAFDRALPAFLMKQDPWHHTNHTNILLYFLVATSLVLILNADIGTLSSVYTYASSSSGHYESQTGRRAWDVDVPWWT